MPSRASVYVGVILLSSIIVAAFMGCDMGDTVRTRTPVGVQKSEGLPSSMTLNQSRHEFDLWRSRIEADAILWRSNLERSDQIADLLSQLVLQQIDDMGPTLAGVPVLGPALPILAGLAGVFVRRPGDVRKSEADQAKDQAWDEAVRQTLDTINNAGKKA